MKNLILTDRKGNKHAINVDVYDYCSTYQKPKEYDEQEPTTIITFVHKNPPHKLFPIFLNLTFDEAIEQLGLEKV